MHDTIDNHLVVMINIIKIFTIITVWAMMMKPTINADDGDADYDCYGHANYDDADDYGDASDPDYGNCWLRR